MRRGRFESTALVHMSLCVSGRSCKRYGTERIKSCRYCSWVTPDSVEENSKDCVVSLLFEMTLFENSNKNIVRYGSALVPSVSGGS